MTGCIFISLHTGVVSREDDLKVDSALIRNGHFSFEYRVTGEPFVATLALPPKDDHLCMVCRIVIVLWRKGM